MLAASQPPTDQPKPAAQMDKLAPDAKSKLGMALGIPPRLRGALNLVARLSDADLDALAEALNALPAFPERSDIAASIRTVISAEEEGDNGRVVAALLNLAVQRRRWDADELARLVASAPGLDVPDERRDSFERFISRVVQAEALVSAARGLDIVFDREHIAAETRVLTDIRPVFGDDVEPQLLGATVINTLSIDYHTPTGPQKLQLAVDERDLKRLQEAIDRALKKSVSLRELLAASDTQYVNYADEDDT